MNSVAPAQLVARILEDPRFFVHGFDSVAGQLTLVETSREKLARLPFIDGREPFAAGAGLLMELSEALAAKWERPPGPDRMIFHMAFCGSTLLATLLDRPGKSFVLREPNLLVDLANVLVSERRDDALRALPLVRDLLRRRWSEGGSTVVKPSNWANPLLPYLNGSPEKLRAVFITIEPDEYLVAAFRGGRPRLEFIIRSAFHFLEGRADKYELLTEATGPADPLARAARFVLLAHKLQHNLFTGAAMQRDLREGSRLSFDEIDRDPIASAIRASRLLDLGIEPEDVEQAWHRIKGRNVKQSDGVWSQGKRTRINAEVQAEHGKRFRDALLWHEQQLASVRALAA